MDTYNYKSEILNQIGLAGFDLGYAVIAVGILSFLLLIVLILLIVQIVKISKLKKRLDCDTDKDDVLLTHDAARPLVSLDTMKRCAAAAVEYGVSGTAVRAVDTVLRCKDGFVMEAPPREEMWLAQTPQCFKLGLFKEVWGTMTEEEKIKLLLSR